MKRLLAVSVAVCLLFCVLSPAASAAGPPIAGGCTCAGAG